MSEPQWLRTRVRCRGTVQGVGFRPAVHRLATALGLAGTVINDPNGATIEVEGPAEEIHAFVDRLARELPPLARLDEARVEQIEPTGATSFEVHRSTIGAREGALVPPDAALCTDCRHEMDDPVDRRHRYPFTTCTNCGPRFSLVNRLPYDRERTSMACFPLCAECRREYEDPRDRRFHAEPIACANCGPRLWLIAPGDSSAVFEGDPIERAQRELEAGGVVALKGLGGFQIACRADSPSAVEVLRSRKLRRGKPFAIMVRDLATARAVVDLDEESEELLTSPRAPIVLAPRRSGSKAVAEEVAPGLMDLGVMLPTTPLHVELFRDLRVDVLVMTSANLSEEPLCRTNRDAAQRLAGIADLCLVHDRDVVRRVDDSVVRSSPRGTIMIRRARGWVPEPLTLPEPAPAPLIAVGGHLQNTACVADREQAFLSQHVGDLESVASRTFLVEVIDGLVDFLQVSPSWIAADQHPDYPSTWIARELCAANGASLIEVQHHLAHAAAVLGEHGAFPAGAERSFAICLDGTGWGADGTAWGGEWLAVDGDLGWRRLAHLEPIPLIGGEIAVRQPWRVAVAALAADGQLDLLSQTPIADQIETTRLSEVVRLAGTGSWPLASGAGRVFEAAGTLLGLGTENRWEGEMAVKLEALAATYEGVVEPWPVQDPVDRELPSVLPTSPLLSAVARRYVSGEALPVIAAGFHATFCALAGSLTECLEIPEGSCVALGGGCFVNRILSDGVAGRIERLGLRPLLPTKVPPGDGGLAYGQAVVAAVAAARNQRPRYLVGAVR